MPDVTDLSGWTFGAPVAQPAGDQGSQQASVPAADITKHDPQTYAALTTQAAIQHMHDMGLMPEVGTGQDIYKQALQDSQNYLKSGAEAARAKNIELRGRAGAVTSGVLGAEEQAKAAVAEQAKQAEQGPGAVAKANEARAAQYQQLISQGKTPEEAQAIVGQTIQPEIKGLDKDDMAKLDAMTGAYDSVNTLSSAFSKMMEKPHLGVGGQIKSLGGVMRVFADATSPEALAFDRAKDAALVPIGRGVMGETGASPTKESMIELAQHTTMPRVEDDELTGNQGIFQLKQKIMQNLQNMRDNRANNGFDTTAIDRVIAKYNSDFMSQGVQKYDPFKPSAPPVAIGTSSAADAAIANLHRANGIQLPSTVPSQFQNAGSVAQQQPNVAPPAVQSSTPGYALPTPAFAHDVQTAQAHQLGQQAAGAVVGGAQATAGAAKTIWDWLQPFPTNQSGQMMFPGQQ